jgi:hypothetical protein
MRDRVEDFRRTVEGATCGTVLAQAYGYHGELVAPVTVLYLQFAPARWARFGIDGGEFHWRETAAPEAIEPDGSGHVYPLVELDASGAITGHRIQGVRFTREPPDGARLSIGLADGATLSLVHANDQSHVEFSPAAI